MCWGGEGDPMAGAACVCPTCVCTDVSFQVAGVAHFLSADGTLVRQLPCVLGPVPPQLRLVEEGCIAVGTWPPTDTHISYTSTSANCRWHCTGTQIHAHTPLTQLPLQTVGSTA